MNNTCTIDYSNPTLLVTITVSFFIPCLLMLAAYGMIFKVARKQEQRVHEMAQVANTVNEQTTSSRDSVRKSNKAAKTLGLITGIFLICYMPFFTITVTEYFHSNMIRSMHISLWNFILVLTYTNSMLNPIIYILCDDSFRKAFAKILCKR